jgi:putative SOS response-associated peptidase YedK
MPVILDPANYAAWLDPDADPAELQQALLKPAPDGLLAYVEVDIRVNSVRNDDETLILPAPGRIPVTAQV